MTTTRIRIREDFPAAPICPHCGKEIEEIAARRVESTLGVRFLYFCTIRATAAVSLFADTLMALHSATCCGRF